MTKIPDTIRKAFEEKFLLTHYKGGITERHGLRCKNEELLEFISSQREEAVREVIEDLSKWREEYACSDWCIDQGIDYLRNKFPSTSEE